MVGIICPPGWYRVNCSAKHWGGWSPPPCDGPACGSKGGLISEFFHLPTNEPFYHPEHYPPKEKMLRMHIFWTMEPKWNWDLTIFRYSMSQMKACAVRIANVDNEQHTILKDLDRLNFTKLPKFKNLSYSNI